jgi:hypothetical protein
MKTEVVNKSLGTTNLCEVLHSSKPFNHGNKYQMKEIPHCGRLLVISTTLDKTGKACQEHGSSLSRPFKITAIRCLITLASVYSTVVWVTKQ